ncbi:MAG: hypothetical protein EBU49_11835 [Proteobacteria bacterium]|nr:hypothetical protein [Pseudomonadota bacterium]
MPVVKKNVLKFADGRSCYPDMGVPPAADILGAKDGQARDIFFAKIESAGQGLLAVDHHQLAVIAKVQLQTPFPAVNGQKTGDKNPVGFEIPDVTTGQVE